MKILVIGDIVGRPGRTAVRDRVQDLREQYKADLIVANVENLAGGYSVTPPLVEELL
ncbi:YmdB family metallophosphoesterase, partial [Klebsiella pneumoniae]|uniref:YmdB family metallophosphoesterase n=1 Tax=Klebsiella pneumoniae TaxID=573 RepID=UPI001BE01E41|nr:YmdB family metallophosphoesterase [Klebsiella pneumoniae]